MADDVQSRAELLEFPCRFPIKVMGRETDGIRNIAVELIGQHAGAINDADVRVAASSKGNFVAVTVTIDATSKAQLDAIYQALTDHPDVLVSL